MLLFPLLALVLGAQLMPFLLMPLVTLGPAMVVPPRGPSRDEGEADDGSGPGGGGGGPGGPRRPIDRPHNPSGGLPLPDAQPSRRRVRDHGGRPIRSGSGPVQPRRPVREPERQPVPIRPHR